MPFAKVGGFCIAMKGDSAEREIEEAKRALFVLKAQAKPLAEVQLPDVDKVHYLVTVEKLEKVLPSMIRKAKLTEEQGTLVRAYLLSQAKLS